MCTRLLSPVSAVCASVAAASIVADAVTLISVRVASAPPRRQRRVTAVSPLLDTIAALSSCVCVLQQLQSMTHCCRRRRQHDGKPRRQRHIVTRARRSSCSCSSSSITHRRRSGKGDRRLGYPVAVALTRHAMAQRNVLPW